jgi:integrase
MASIRYTSEVSLSGGKVVKFPLILSGQFKVNWLCLNYFLDLQSQGVSAGSIHTYAHQLCDLVSQLEAEGGMAIDQVHDAWLIAYKNSILERSNTEDYASQVLRTCLAFFKWLEDEEYFTNLIGEDNYCRIRIKLLESGMLKHPAIKVIHKYKRRTITPRIEWINAIKPYGPGRDDLASRFNLMVDWGADLGLRAKEICALTISQLPTLETAQKALRDEKNLQIKLTVTKGSVAAVIPVSPLLIKKTWDFIHTDRCNVVETWVKRKLKRRTVFHDTGYVFLSDKTGGKLTTTSFSNTVRNAFLAAVEAKDLTIDERVWLHGLRHNFTANLLKSLDESGVERPEAIARQVTRHGSEEAMEPYLSDRFNEDFHG